MTYDIVAHANPFYQSSIPIDLVSQNIALVSNKTKSLSPFFSIILHNYNQYYKL